MSYSDPRVVAELEARQLGESEFWLESLPESWLRVGYKHGCERQVTATKRCGVPARWDSCQLILHNVMGMMTLRTALCPECAWRFCELTDAAAPLALLEAITGE